jgi:hypothetical protein
MSAMLRRVSAFFVALFAMSALVVAWSRLSPADLDDKSSESITAKPVAAIERFIRDDSSVFLPKASRPFLPLPTDRPDYSSIRTPGTYSGNWYGAFETSWFQSDGSEKIWLLTGDVSARLWDYWETSRTIPYDANHPDFDPMSDRPLDKWFWPYVCIRVKFSGVQEVWQVEPRPVFDVIHGESLISAELVNLALEDCVVDSILENRDN